jgi:hypothetical protein
MPRHNEILSASLDLEILSRDIQTINSADAVAAFFARSSEADPGQSRDGCRGEWRGAEMMRTTGSVSSAVNSQWSTFPGNVIDRATMVICRTLFPLDQVPHQQEWRSVCSFRTATTMLGR